MYLSCKVFSVYIVLKIYVENKKQKIKNKLKAKKISQKRGSSAALTTS